MKIGKGHTALMPYIIVDNATEFIQFLEEVFDAELVISKPRDYGLIKHAEMKIGKETIMLADAVHEHSTKTAGLFIYIKNIEETYYKALNHNCISVMSIQENAFGSNCKGAGVEDKFGNTWWLAQLD